MIEVIEKIGNIENLSLKNEEMEVVVSTFGCTIIKMIIEDKNGVKGDVVLGYDDFNQYQTLDGYLGALVGRVANRIGKGTFELNGETYHFVNTDDFMQKMKNGFFAEWKAYTTTEGVWYYGSSLEDIENADDKSVIILTPQGYRDVKEKLPDKNITCIYLYENIDTMKKRLSKRGDDTKEVERRIKSDLEDFKNFESEADKIVYNNDGTDIDEVIKKILDFVEEK